MDARRTVLVVVNNGELVNIVTLVAVARRVLFRPLLQLRKVPAHSHLPVPCDEFCTRAGPAEIIIRVTHDVLSYAVEAMHQVPEAAAPGEIVTSLDEFDSNVALRTKSGTHFHEVCFFFLFIFFS
jgi:hypothetical protein